MILIPYVYYFFTCDMIKDNSELVDIIKNLFTIVQYFKKTKELTYL